jgi:hypothetical protein
MKSKVIINAAATAQLPDTAEVGKPITIQLAPEGCYPQVVDDDQAEGGQREVVQVLDAQAMRTLVENFEKAKSEAEAKGQKYGVLVDADHSSETSTNTAAMGWVTKLFVDPEKGLMAEIDPTSEGVEKINGKVYRFVSGAWTLDDDNRPVELVSIGLTNKPNLPVAPMINAQAAKKEEPGTQPAKNGGEGVTADGPSAAANAGEDKGEGAKAAGQAGDGDAKPKTENDKTNPKGVINMDLKEKLGLPAEATDADVEVAVDALIERCKGMEQVQNALGLEETASNEEVLEAVNAVVNQCGDLQAKNEEIEKEKLEGEAETFVSENADVIPEEMVDEVKEEYVEDKDKAVATVANFRKVHDRAVLNAAKAAQKTEVRTAVVFKNSEAKTPAVGIAGIIAQCNGDPKAINAAIVKMARRG